MNDNDPYELNDPGDDDQWLSESTENDDALNQPPPTPGPYPPAQAGPPTYVSVPCLTCGYNLTGIAIGGNCPECGVKVDESLFSASSGQGNGLAIASLVLGIISLPTSCCCLISLPTAITGLVLGNKALNQMKAGSYPQAGRGMALAGVWCSVIGLVFTALLVLLNALSSL